MVRRRRNSFAKIGTVAMTLVLALGITGIGYGLWSDTVDVTGTMKMGTWQVELIEGSHSDNVSCNVNPSNKLNIEITDASPGYYYQNFDIHNSGTVPVKTHSVPISSPAGVTTTVSGVPIDYQIEAGETLSGCTVDMQVTSAGSYSGIEVTIEIIRWNE